MTALICGKKRGAGTSLPLNGSGCSGPGLPLSRVRRAPGPAAERREGTLPVGKVPVSGLRGARPQTGPGAARLLAHGKRPSP